MRVIILPLIALSLLISITPVFSGEHFGLMLVKGSEIEKDHKEVLKWKQPAEEGDAQAQFKLGSLYYKGQGVTQSDEKALFWLKKSAKQNYTYAQFFIGAMYFGGFGVGLNYIEADKWFYISEANGYEDEGHLREMIEKKMTREEIDVAKELVREWMKVHQK